MKTASLHQLALSGVGLEYGECILYRVKYLLKFHG